MQMQKMYAIYDDAAGAYMTPFFFANDLLAIRTFGSLVNDPGHLFNQNPNDFSLYCFAQFDSSTGEVIAEPPRIVRAGQALVNRQVDPRQGDMLSGSFPKPHSPYPEKEETK